MNLWYAVAKTSQAYTVVANHVDPVPAPGADAGAEPGAQPSAFGGASGIYTINPVDAEPPVVASTGAPEVVRCDLTTLGDPGWWLGQARLIAGRRVDLATPLVLATDSPAFTRWRDAPGYDTSGWTAY